MFATLALRSIKCVNSNLWGIYNFTSDHIGLIAGDWNDRERLRGTCFSGFTQFDQEQQSYETKKSTTLGAVLTGPRI
jgi:hypothetical protein